MQLSFGDAEGLGSRKRTRREVFLAEMDQVVPWKALLALIEPHYPKQGRPGRQPYPLSSDTQFHALRRHPDSRTPGRFEVQFRVVPSVASRSLSR
jgi:IS5 family transposase